MFRGHGLALEGDQRVRAADRAHMPEVASELGDIAPVENEQAEAIDLTDVCELVTQEARDLCRRGFAVQIDAAAQRDGDHVAHEPRTQPPWIARPYLRARVRDGVFDGLRQVHIIAAMRELYRC